MIESAPHLHCPRMSEIVTTVCDHFRVSKLDFFSNRRSRDIARPRQIAMWLARKMTIRSYPEIAQFLHRADHTTVMHGVQQIERLLTQNQDLALDLQSLQRRIKNRVTLREALEQSVAEAA